MAGIWDRAKHFVAQPVGWGSQLAGTLTSAGGLLPNRTASGLTSIGHSITNPNIIYRGPTNPIKIWNQGPSGGANWTTVTPPTSSGETGVAQSDTTAVPDSGLYDGSGSYDPNTDPTAINNLRNSITGLMSLFNQAFQDVVGRVDTMAAQKKQDIIKNYGEQQGNLQTNFGNTARTINDIMFGQGAGNSSYTAVQQGAAKDAFDTAVGQLGEAQTGDLADVGQYATTTKAQLAAGKPNYDVNNYNTVSDLQTISDAVNQALGNLRIANAGLGTKGEYVANLNAITPKQEQGSAALKAQLIKLSGVNAPPDAKRAIAETIINNNSTDAGNDQAWIDYFDQLLAQTGSGATIEPVPVV